MDPGGADPDLCPEAIAVTVSESRAHVMKNGGAVDALKEASGSDLVLGDDHLRMTASIAMDMIDRGVESWHDRDG